MKIIKEQILKKLAPLMMTAYSFVVPVNIPGFNLNLDLRTNDIVESPDRLFVTQAEKLAIGQTAGTISSNLVVVEQGQSIQSAINSLTSGGIIIIKAGEFLENITITNGIQLIGSGMGVTIIRQPNGANVNVVSVLNASNWSISNLTIDGNKANNPTGDNGLVIFGGNHFIVRNVESRDNKLKGMVIAADSANVEDGVFEYNDTHDNGQDGLAIASGTIASGFKCRRISIIGNKSHHNIQYGIGVVTPDTMYAKVEDVIVDGNVAYSNGTYGIEFKGGNKLTIVNNTSYLNGYHGLNLGLHTHTQFKVSNSRVSGNRVYNNSKAMAGYAGLNTQSTEYTIVSENQVFDDQATKSQKGLTGNSGTGNVVVNNIVYNNLP